MRIGFTQLGRVAAALFVAATIGCTAGTNASPTPAPSTGGSASPASASLTQDVNMRQNIGPLAYYAPLHVGVQQGFFKANHINMQLIDLPAGSLDAPAILNGDLEAGDVGFNDIAALKAQNKDLIAVYDLQNRVTLDFVVATKFLKDHNLSPAMPVLDRMKGLKGMRIGISSPGAPTDLFARYYLKTAGLNPDVDAQIIRIGSIAGLLAALRSDQIDGYMLSAPSPQQVEQQGLGTILIKSSAGDVPALANFYYTVFAMRADYVQKNPAIVTAYVKSIQQANDWMRTHHDETVAILKKVNPSVDAAVMTLAYDLLLGSISKDGKFEQKAVQDTLDFYKAAGAITSVPDAAEGVTWTNKFH